MSRCAPPDSPAPPGTAPDPVCADYAPETCPQYLVLTAEHLHVPGFEGAKYICSPPPRDAASHQAVWRGLASGVFHVVSSDHAAFRFDDPEGKRRHGLDAPFAKVPNGLPGVETRLPLLFSEGVGKGRIDLETFVALTATNAAKIYGPLSAQGHHRDRIRRRPRHLGQGPGGRDRERSAAPPV